MLVVAVPSVLTVAVIPLLVCLLLFVGLYSAVARRRRRRRAAARAAAAPPAQTGPATAMAAPAEPPSAPRRGRFPWDAVGFAAIFLVIALGVIRGWDTITVDYRVIPPSIPALESEVAGYADIDGLHKNLSDAPLTGKVVVIDKGRLTLHPLMRKLPKSIRAATPDEVAVVVWVQTTRVPAFDLVAVPESSRYTSANIPGYTESDPPPADSPTVPAYRADWKVTVIDLASKEIRRVQTFEGPQPPGGWITFKSLIGSPQICVYEGDDRVAGAEILWGDESPLKVSGKPLVGIVGAPAWDETLAWIEEAMGMGGE